LHEDVGFAQQRGKDLAPAALAQMPASGRSAAPMGCAGASPI